MLVTVVVVVDLDGDGNGDVEGAAARDHHDLADQQLLGDRPDPHRWKA